MLLKKRLILQNKKFFRYKTNRGLRRICKRCENFPTTVTSICPGCYKIELLPTNLSNNNLKEYTYNTYKLSF